MEPTYSAMALEDDDQATLDQGRRSSRNVGRPVLYKEVATPLTRPTALPRGTRISVYWEGDDKWFSGEVREFNEATEMHTVVYDDGDQRPEFLSKPGATLWKLEEAAAQEQPKPGRHKDAEPSEHEDAQKREDDPSEPEVWPELPNTYRVLEDAPASAAAPPLPYKRERAPSTRVIEAVQHRKPQPAFKRHRSPHRPKKEAWGLKAEVRPARQQLWWGRPTSEGGSGVAVVTVDAARRRQAIIACGARPALWHAGKRPPVLRTAVRLGEKRQAVLPPLEVASVQGPPAPPPLCLCGQPSTWHSRRWWCAACDGSGGGCAFETMVPAAALTPLCRCGLRAAWLSRRWWCPRRDECGCGFERGGGGGGGGDDAAPEHAEPTLISTREIEAQMARATAAWLTSLAHGGSVGPRAFVADSDCGLGLFARGPLRAGQTVAEYGGPRLPISLLRRGEYALVVTRTETFIDGAWHNADAARSPYAPATSGYPRYLATFANHSRRPNARFEERHVCCSFVNRAREVTLLNRAPSADHVQQRMVLVATEPIDAGSELRVDYEHGGSVYWDALGSATMSETSWRGVRAPPPPPADPDDGIEADAPLLPIAPPLVCAPRQPPVPWEGRRGADLQLRLLARTLQHESSTLNGAGSLSSASFALIASHLPGRTGAECRERWRHLTSIERAGPPLPALPQNGAHRFPMPSAAAAAVSADAWLAAEAGQKRKRLQASDGQRKRGASCGQCSGCKAPACGRCKPCTTPEMRKRCEFRKCASMLSFSRRNDGHQSVARKAGVAAVAAAAAAAAAGGDSSAAPAPVPTKPRKALPPGMMEQQIVMPAGQKPGDKFRFRCADGRVVQVPLPSGVRPGQSVTIIFPAKVLAPVPPPAPPPLVQLQLRREMQSEMQSEMQTRICSFHDCGKAFPDAASLRRHMHTHDERQHVCQVEGCGKRFLDSSKLKRHSLTHTGERPYLCPFEGCGKRFSLDFNLRSHMRTHTGETPSACTYPDKRFAQEQRPQEVVVQSPTVLPPPPPLQPQPRLPQPQQPQPQQPQPRQQMALGGLGNSWVVQPPDAAAAANRHHPNLNFEIATPKPLGAVPVAVLHVRVRRSNGSLGITLDGFNRVARPPPTDAPSEARPEAMLQIGDQVIMVDGSPLLGSPVHVLLNQLGHKDEHQFTVRRVLPA